MQHAACSDSLLSQVHSRDAVKQTAVVSSAYTHLQLCTREQKAASPDSFAETPKKTLCSERQKCKHRHINANHHKSETSAISKLSDWKSNCFMVRGVFNTL